MLLSTESLVALAALQIDARRQEQSVIEYAEELAECHGTSRSIHLSYGYMEIVVTLMTYTLVL